MRRSASPLANTLVSGLHQMHHVTDLAHTLLAWLGRHTYAVVFVSTLIDATAIPFPGRIVLAAAGAVAASGNVSPLALVVLGGAGVVLADHLWYFAGSLGGDRLLRWYCRLSFTPASCAPRASAWLTRFGPLVIVVGRFVALVRVFAWPLARRHGVGYLMFLALDVPAALAWTAVWVGLGWLLGARWADAPDEARWVGVGLVVVAAATMVAVRLRRRRAGQARA
jgi:membrane protein DedA with SNARE-associated domain